MSWTGITATIIATAVVVGVAAYFVFRLTGVELRRRHMEVGTTIFLQLGVIYAVFLAFVFGQALTGYVGADDAIDAECAALHAASVLSGPLPPSERARLEDAIQDYITTVIATEWPTMARTRKGSAAAREGERTLIRMANEWHFADAGQTNVQGRILSLLMKAHGEREHRLFEAAQGIPAGLWVMILIYCGSLVTLVLFASLEYVWSHTMLAGAFGGLNALVLLAVFVLQYPFEGPLRLSSDTFRETLTKLREDRSQEIGPRQGARPAASRPGGATAPDTNP